MKYLVKPVSATLVTYEIWSLIYLPLLDHSRSLVTNHNLATYNILVIYRYLVTYS